MKTEQQTTAIFEDHLKEYEQWFEEHPAILASESAAFRELLPEGDLYGIEIGSGTGHLALSIGLKEGVEPSDKLRAISVERGLEAMAGRAEELPYKDLHFDFVLLSTALHYVEDIDKAFKEAYRVLKTSGCLLLGFLDPESVIGKEYISRRKQSTFYRHADFYSIHTLERKLSEAGFKSLAFYQTLFGSTDEIAQVQKMLPGTGIGSFILIKAIKNRTL
jgi:ubiquinone/menaquinone biosynthesis C-methylase UbiE